jgi:hypothetical protein
VSARSSRRWGRRPAWLLWLASCWLILAVGSAAASPRLALVDGADAPALHQALQISLAPWSIEVVDWPADPSGADAAAVAERANARYVVWHDGRELVVLDAALAQRDTRPLEAMPQDEATASSVALSIKTMLRLPPALPARAEPARWRWLPSARLGGRVGFGGDGGGGLRAQAALEVQPPGFAGVRLGVVAELGDASEVSRGQFKGEWSEWSAQASVAREIPVRSFVLAVQLAGGVSRAALTGEEMRTSRTEVGTSACGSVSALASRALGPLTLGVLTSLTVRGASHFARANGTSLWQEPSTLAAVMAQVALPL